MEGMNKREEHEGIKGEESRMRDSVVAREGT